MVFLDLLTCAGIDRELSRSSTLVFSCAFPKHLLPSEVYAACSRACRPERKPASLKVAIHLAHAELGELERRAGISTPLAESLPPVSSSLVSAEGEGAPERL